MSSGAITSLSSTSNSSGAGDVATKQTDPRLNVGSGVNGAQGAVPAAPAELAFMTVLASLDAFAPKVSQDDLEILLAEIESKLKDTETRSDIGRIDIDSAFKEAALAAKKKQLDDAQQKLQEAESAAQGVSIWDKIKLAFQAFAAVLTMAVGVVLCATGAGGPAGALLLAAGALQLMGVVNSIMQQTEGHGILGELVKALGGSDTQAADADIAFTAYVAVASLVIGVTSGYGLYAGMIDLATLSSQVSEIIATTTQAVTGILTGIGDGVASGFTYQATVDRAQAKTDQGDAKTLDAFTTQIDAFIQMIIKDLSAVNKTYSDTLGSIMNSLQDVNNTLTHAKLTA